MDWAEFSPNTADDETLRAIEVDVAAFFARHTMQELYDIRLRDQPHARPDQLAARDPRQRAARGPGVLRPARRRTSSSRRRSSTVRVRRRRRAARPRPPAPRPRLGRGHRRPRGRRVAARSAPTRVRDRARGRARTSSSSARARPGRSRRATSSSTARPCCASSRRAGPTSCASTRSGPNNPHGLEGAPMFDGLNVGKRDVTLNLKHPKAVELVRRLVVEWADAVAENFAPRAMRGFGLDYDVARRGQARPRDAQRVPERPDRAAPRLPRLRRPGLGARRATTSSPAGPTASPSARTAPSPTRSRRGSPRPRSPPGCCTAAAPGAASTSTCRRSRRRSSRCRRGCSSTRRPARTRGRHGNASDRAVVHGVLALPRTTASVGDRWVAVAAWTDDEAALLDDHRRRRRRRRGRRPDPARGRRDAPGRGHRGGAGPGLRRPARRPAARATAATSSRSPTRSSAPASTSATASGSPTRPAATTAPGPTLGQDQDWVLDELLGLDADEQAALAADGAFD